MSEQEKQESQKTVVAFIAGLLIGGLLVWVFSGNPEEHKDMDMDADNTSEMSEDMDADDTEADSDDASASTNDTAETSAVAELPVGDGAASVMDQAAGLEVSLSGATFPSDEGWIAVRNYNDGQFGNVLGAARYSKEQGLVPEMVTLLAPTVAGNTYAIVFYSENGDRMFNLAEDVQVTGAVETFTAK